MKKVARPLFIVVGLCAFALAVVSLLAYREHVEENKEVRLIEPINKEFHSFLKEGNPRALDVIMNGLTYRGDCEVAVNTYSAKLLLAYLKLPQAQPLPDEKPSSCYEWLVQHKRNLVVDKSNHCILYAPTQEHDL